MPEKIYNKVVYGGKVLIDLTQDTVTPKKLIKGYTAHSADGNIINGDYELPSFTVEESTKTLVINYEGDDIEPLN